MKKRAIRTVYDIAEAAGVSVATVSRVLNKHPNVSAKTRERVLEFMRESEFRPNANARRLVAGGTEQACFLLSNRHVAHSFHSRILMGVEDYFQHVGGHVVFTTIEYGPDAEFPNDALPRIIRQRGDINGLLLAGVNHPCFLKYVDRLHIPYVLFGNNLVTGLLELPKKNSVSFDEVAGAHHATVFLSELGHRRITFIGDLSKPWYRRRYEGYRTAMGTRASPESAIDIRNEESAFELGRKAVPLLVAKHPDTTAVLAQDDETACGILDGFRRLGIRVPQDISIVGYDDITEIQYLHPALTTVRVPKEKIGWSMAELLSRTREGRHALMPEVIGTELIVRDSCAKFMVKSVSVK